jgi:hypothetical protein
MKNLDSICLTCLRKWSIYVCYWSSEELNEAVVELITSQLVEIFRASWAESRTQLDLSRNIVDKKKSRNMHPLHLYEDKSYIDRMRGRHDHVAYLVRRDWFLTPPIRKIKSKPSYIRMLLVFWRASIENSYLLVFYVSYMSTTLKYICILVVGRPLGRLLAGKWRSNRSPSYPTQNGKSRYHVLLCQIESYQSTC